jgi:hypothetical protein
MKIKERLQKINDFVALKLTLIFGTMWTCYLFFVYGLLPCIPLFTPYQNTLMYWSGWIQLWALPLLMVGQNVLGKASEKRAQDTYDMVKYELQVVKDEQNNAKLEREDLKTLMQEIQDDQKLENEENAKLEQIISELRLLVEEQHSNVQTIINNKETK